MMRYLSTALMFAVCYCWFAPPVGANPMMRVEIVGQQEKDTDSDQVLFNRDIRPILSDRCYLCHGPDQSSDEAQDLRLDERPSAIEYGIFDFENIDASEFLLRVISDDPDDQMPPVDSLKQRLGKTEIATIRKWIQQGAKYDRHWAYVPPHRPAIPPRNPSGNRSSPIDRLVQMKLEREHLHPSPPADRSTLIRRVSFDLTGLPPSIDEIDTFLGDPDSDDLAIEKVIDRLLASPHFGEQMARFWLDAARYADTGGYQYDRERTQWVWRDWVVHAFNTNMPFDQFTIEQLAGDLLPNATDQTRLATGFNRNHPITIEGGVVDEEYRTEYVIDRVVTTSTVWMGQTFLCARCHDHKYDPISQKDFYQFYSFFNNVPEKGLNGFDPRMVVASPLEAKKIETLKRALDRAQGNLDQLPLPLDEWFKRLQAERPSWKIVIPESVVSTGGASYEILDDKSVLLSGLNPETDDYEVIMPVKDQSVVAIRLEALSQDSFANGAASRSENGNFVVTEFVVESAAAGAGEEFTPVKILSASADYEQKGYSIDLAIDGKIERRGWAVDGDKNPGDRNAVFELEHPIEPGGKIRIKIQQRFGTSHLIGRFRLSFSSTHDLSPRHKKLLAITARNRTQQQAKDFINLLILKYGKPEERRRLDIIESLDKELAVATSFPQTMVMKEMPEPRKTFVLDRGEYDHPRRDEPLSVDVPPAIGLMPEGLPRNRLGLAQWLVSPEQPLTARVTVNRFWQELFGVGLVKTSEDFGSQGEYPVHPELLDWLAVEFMESGWDVKAIYKTILMSQTYRQSSKITPASFARDPENRMLSRGPRMRLDGEEIRDSALMISGLLDRKIGGASVYPYHPEGLWLEINNRPNLSRPYPHSTDTSNLYRRSMYTFWKRTVTPPSVAMFDAPSREYCVVRRSRTNTPLQAFVMLHDPQFVEAARHLAARMIHEGGETTRSRIAFGFRLCTSRRPNDDEISILKDAFDDQIVEFESNPQWAEKLLSVGVSKNDDSINPQELAAWTQVARMLINLSEFITKG